MGLPRWHSGEESTCQWRRRWSLGFNLWVGKVPWSRKWKLIPVFLPRKFHGQRRLVGYSPWDRKELDIMEHTHTQQSKTEWFPHHPQVFGNCCCCCSVTQSCLTICLPTDHSTQGFPGLHHLLELAQTHVHWVGEPIQPSHPLSPPSPPTFNLSQHQGLF